MFPLPADLPSGDRSHDGASPTNAPYGAPPPFTCEIFRKRDHVRVAPSGELDIATTPELEWTLAELVDSGAGHVILDLRGLSFMDSTGLRLLLERNAASRADSHRFTLIAGPPEVQRLFDLTATTERFDFITPRPPG
jgi:anti-sigma B factor antagonist